MDVNMNVKHLILKTAMHENEFMGITFLFNSCPTLESLTIELGLPKNLYVSITYRIFFTHTFILGFEFASPRIN